MEKEDGKIIENKIKNQKKVVKNLQDLYKKDASEKLRLELERETDRLRHYTNAMEGNPKERAKKTWEKAGKITLNKIIQLIKPEK